MGKERISLLERIVENIIPENAGYFVSVMPLEMQDGIGESALKVEDVIGRQWYVPINSVGIRSSRTPNENWAITRSFECLKKSELLYLGRACRYSVADSQDFMTESGSLVNFEDLGTLRRLSINEDHERERVVQIDHQRVIEGKKYFRQRLSEARMEYYTLGGYRHAAGAYGRIRAYAIDCKKEALRLIGHEKISSS